MEVPNLEGRIITFIGPEGSGKSTLGKRLADECGKPFISTGDLSRKHASDTSSRFYPECEAALREGRYVDSGVLLEMLIDCYCHPETENGFVVDGGLRRLKETKDYPEFLKSVNRDLPMTVVFLRIPGWEGMQRIIFNNDARRREGDTVEGVLVRLDNFYDQLAQRASFIRHQPNWNLVHLSALSPKEETYQKLCAALQQGQ